MTKYRKFIVLPILVVLIINLSFIAFGFAFINQARSTLYAEKVNYLREISLKTAQNIQIYINGYISTVNAIATFLGAQKTFDAENAISILKIESAKNSFKRMGIIFPDGNAITTDNMTFDLGERTYFKQAMQGISSVSDKLLIDKIGGEEINVIASPVYYNGEIIAVIFATKSQNDFSEIMQIDSFAGEGYSYVITSDGSPVVRTTHPNSVGDYDNLFYEISKNKVNEKHLEKMKKDINNGCDGTFENTEKQIKSQIYYAKININDWYLIYVIPCSAISLKSDRLIITLTFFTAIVIVFISIYSIIVVYNLKKHYNQLEIIAYKDKITGFSNWDKLCTITKDLIQKNKDSNYAIISFDINKFKVLNDLFGHNVGNIALKSIAEIVNKDLSPNEAFARISSDNFTIFIQYKNTDEIIKRIEQLANEIENIIDDYKLELSAGIYLIDEKDIDVNIEIINDRANIARLVAKQQNNIFYSFFDEKSRLAIVKEKEIENIMKDALLNNEFEVYLQPKYLLKTDTITGAEALVRWNRKGVGLMSPNEFIPLFEKNGFIRLLDLYMFEQVCCLLSKWSFNKSMNIVPISVNISRVHLSDKSLPQKLLSIINQFNVDVNFLEFELTESAIYLDIENMKAMMKKIKELGIRLSIDDFGSGYSSLSTLKDLPIDVVKLDKSFFDNPSDDGRGQAIIGNIISMSKILGLSTVAEGVETIEQVNFLKLVDCEIAQGYFYSRPICIEKFEELISTQAT